MNSPNTRVSIAGLLAILFALSATAILAVSTHDRANRTTAKLDATQPSSENSVSENDPATALGPLDSEFPEDPNPGLTFLYSSKSMPVDFETHATVNLDAQANQANENTPVESSATDPVFFPSSKVIFMGESLPKQTEASMSASTDENQ